MNVSGDRGDFKISQDTTGFVGAELRRPAEADFMKTRTLIWSIAVVAVLSASVYAARLPILLHISKLRSIISHPIGPNQPVPWQQGPAIANVQVSERPPNVIVILLDDLGYNDLSMYGAGMPELPTPHIDSIAEDGVRFEQGYAAHATCAPSRAALLTGRYAQRAGFEFTPTPGNMGKVVPMIYERMDRRLPAMVDAQHMRDLPPFEQMGLPPTELTLADLLAPLGYHNVHIGKWHLGGTPEFRPQNQGFHETLFMEGAAYLPADHPDVVNARVDFDPIDLFLWANMRYATSYNSGDWFEPNGYLTDFYTDEAVRVIEANRNRPFFLYLAHWGPHTPLQALREDYDALADIPDHRRRVYAAMIRALDRGIGRVLRALRDHGLEGNTLVILTSDNGGAHYIGVPGINDPFRGWKMTFFEGGVRVPYAMKWPAALPSGAQYAHAVSGIDVMPTVLAAAGGALLDDRTIDGRNLLPYLRGEKSGAPHDALFWRSGDYRMLIAGEWKLQVSERPDKIWLFNIAEDPGERHNLADSRLDKVRELKTLLAGYEDDMAEPIWPTFVAMPVPIDKTLADPESGDDEYIYWPN